MGIRFVLYSPEVGNFELDCSATSGGPNKLLTRRNFFVIEAYVPGQLFGLSR